MYHMTWHLIEPNAFISNKPDMNNIAFVFVHHIEIDPSFLKVLEQLYSVSLEV